jgi:hypothetical protein
MERVGGQIHGRIAAAHTADDEPVDERKEPVVHLGESRRIRCAAPISSRSSALVIVRVSM